MIKIGTTQGNLKIIDADRQNARILLNQEEKKFEELSQIRDEKYKDLQNKAKNYGQGIPQLVETFQAAENFTGVLEKQVKYEAFAEKMLFLVENFESQLKKIDNAPTNSDKIKRITGLQKTSTTKFMRYLQTEFNGKLDDLIDVGAKAHDVAYLKEWERKVFEKERRMLEELIDDKYAV